MKSILPFVLCLFFVSQLFAQPTNDNCDNPITVLAGETISFSTIEATTDGPFHPAATTPCPSSLNDTLFNDIWYVFTADFDGLAEWSMCGTADFDTKIAVYQPGTACPAQDGDLYTCNDDGSGCAGSTSRLFFNVAIGEVYLLRLGGYGESSPGLSGTGTFTIGEFISTVPNDFCAQALPVSIGMDQVFSNVDATTDGPEHPNDASCFGFNDNTVQTDIWYSFTPDVTETVEWTTCDQINFDSRLAVYQAGSSCPPVDGDLMACNDDGSGCSAYTSRVLFDVVAGETYLLRLGGFGGETGSGTFDLFGTTPPEPPANDLCVDADLGWLVTEQQFDDFEMPIQGTTVNGTFDAGSWIPPNPQCFGDNNISGEYSTVWYKFNSLGNEELDIYLFKGTDAEGATHWVELFDDCSTPVDTLFLFNSCFGVDDIEVFDSTKVLGLPDVYTDYYIRVTTRLTNALPGDFFLFIVAPEGGNTVSTIEAFPGQFNLFPNPVTDQLQLQIALNESTSTDISIVNSLGQTVLTESKGILSGGQHQLQLPTEHLPSGVYFMVLQSKEGRSTVRFVKE